MTDDGGVDEMLAGIDETDRRVVALVLAGATNKAIGRELFLAEGTIKWRLHRLYRRLGVANRTQFVLRVQRQADGTER